MTTAQAGASLIQQALGSLSPILVANFALSQAQLGIVFSAILFGAACCTALAGALTDRWGERRMLLGSAAVMTLALLGATLSATYPWLVAMMVCYGAGYASSTPAGGRAVLAWFDRDRGFAMGVRQTGVSIGALVGALGLPPVASGFGYRGAFVFAALLVVLPSVLAFALYRESADVTSAPATLRSLARGMGTLMRDRRLIAVTLTCMLLSATQFVMAAFVTITAVQVVHTSVHLAGLVLAAGFVGAICGRLGWGIVSDRFFCGDRLIPLAIIAVLAATASAMLAFAGAGAVLPLFAAGLLLGVSAAGWNGLMAAALSEIGGPERAASALGLGLTGIFAASAVAPWLFGCVADRWSLHWAWALMAILCFAATAPVVWLRMRSGARQVVPAPGLQQGDGQANPTEMERASERREGLGAECRR
jgi:ACS family hexuronate transporter-like MFS transporter